MQTLSNSNPVHPNAVNTNLALLGMVTASAAVAMAAVYYETAFSMWSRGHAAALPLVTLLLLCALLHPRLRHMLMITLCFGVSFLALRDIVRLPQNPLPSPLNYEEWEALRVIDLLFVAALSAAAAVAETVRPGTVWARRCYFGAAALYFFGFGVLTYFRHTSWQAILLMGTGITAGIGCVFAHRIVATEVVDRDEALLPSDEVLQQAREATHRAALQAKEWRDNFATVIDERDASSTSRLAN